MGSQVARFWFWTWLVAVVGIWAGSFVYGQWEFGAGLRHAASVTALGGIDGGGIVRIWLWRGLFGSILWTGAAVAMAIATAEGGRRHRESGEASAAW